MGRDYSTGISIERHERMMESSDARAERRQEILAQIPTGIGMIITGRSRDFVPKTLTGPYVLAKDLVIAAGRRLAWRDVSDSKFTAKIPKLTDPVSYQNYTGGGNRHNQRRETDPSEREQARLARQRQTQHVADRLHRQVWSEWQLAELFSAAVGRVKRQVQAKEELDETAVHIAASAIEDYGFSLRESENCRLISSGGWIADNLAHIGLRAVDAPESLRAQHPETFLLVQREQERRALLWGDLLDMYEQPIEEGWGGNRRTTQDLEDQLVNMQIIEDLSVDVNRVE